MNEDDRTLDGPDERGVKILEMIRAPGDPATQRVIQRGPVALARQQAILPEDEEASTLLSDDMADAERFSAMLESSFLVAAAKKEISPEESHALASILVDLTGGLLPLEEVGGLLASFAAALSQEGFEARAQSVAQALSEPALREAAFVLAAGAALLDGGLVEGAALPREPFETLAEAFELSREESEALLVKVSDALS